MTFQLHRFRLQHDVFTIRHRHGEEIVAIENGEIESECAIDVRDGRHVATIRDPRTTNVNVAMKVSGDSIVIENVTLDGDSLNLVADS